MTDHPDPTSGPLPPKPVNLDRIQEGMRLVLEGLGQEGKDEVMRNTPRRIAEMWTQAINPPDVDVEADFRVFPNPGLAGDDAIYVEAVHYVSWCEHHLAPAFGVATLGYVPDEHVAGYSKLKKALNYVTRQPQLNERIIVEALDFLEGRLQPKGIALVTKSVHCCIAVRTNAPSQEIVTIQGTRGLFATDPVLRADFRARVDATRPLFTGG